MTQTDMRHARCRADERDLAAQRRTLAELGLQEDRVYLGYGYAGTNRQRRKLAAAALAAASSDDTFGVTGLGAVAAVEASRTKDEDPRGNGDR